MINILTPTELGNIPNNIVELFQDLENFVILDFSRRLKKAGQITSTAEFQRQQSKLYGIKNIEAKIAATLNLSYKQMETLFPEVAAVSLAAESEIYKRAKLNTIDYKSKQIQDYIKAAIKHTKGDIENITQSLGFAEVQNGKAVYSSVAKFYQKELNLAHVKIQTGVSDYNSAIKQATRKLAESGLRTISYDSGTSINIDSGVRRAVLTGVHQMNREMTDYCMEQILGKDTQRYLEVTWHSGARPSHWWGGMIFKDDR